MTTLGRFFAGFCLIAGTYVLSWLGSFAIDPAIWPWGLIAPLLLAAVAGLLAIPMHRVAAPMGPFRWVVVAAQLALPLYVVVATIHFHTVMGT